MKHFLYILLIATVMGMAPGSKSSPYPLCGLLVLGIGYAIVQRKEKE